MFKVVKDHPKVFWAIIILIILVSILSVYEKQKYKANPYENQIGNPPREDKVFNDTYYYEKLSDNEKKAYEKNQVPAVVCPGEMQGDVLKSEYRRYVYI